MIITQREAIQHLVELIYQPPTSPGHALIAMGGDEWIRQYPSERQSFEYYLNLNAGSAGQHSAATIIQMEHRNHFIRQAILDIQRENDLGIWPACKVVAERICKLRSLPKHIRVDRIHKPKDSAEFHLLRAFYLNMELPCSQQGIFNITKSTPSIDFGFLKEK